MDGFPQFFLIDPEGSLPDLAMEGAGENFIRTFVAPPQAASLSSPLLVADHEGAAEMISNLRKDGHLGAVIVMRQARDTRRTSTLIDLGADDDLLLPVTAAELQARAQAITRRSQEIYSPLLDVCGIRISGDGRLPEVDGHEIPFSPHEARIFEQLLRNAGRYVTRSALYDSLYSLSNRAPSDSAIEVHISNIRRKLRNLPVPVQGRIETSRGRGYRFI